MVMRYITIILIALLCAACSSALPSLKPYRMDIQQGNVVTSKMMLQLRPGMTKSQVRFIMGTPLIQDSFHANRWDYFYQMRKDGKIIEQRRVILEFENEALKRVRGDVIPAGAGEAVADPSPVTESSKSVKKRKQEKGLLDRLKFWEDEPEQEVPQEAPAELISPAAVPAEPAPAQEKSTVESTPAQEEQPQIEPTQEAPSQQPAEGMPEPAAPLGPDPKDVERQVAPAVETPQAREIGDSPAPAAEETQRETQPAPELAPASESAPGPASAPVAEPQPERAAPSAPAPAVEPVSAKQPAQAPAPQRSSPAPESESEPADDGLPPVDDPGYFERMLEKIGF